MTERIVAVAPVTEAELQLFREGFNRAFPADEAPCFGGLLQAIDEVDRAFSATLRRDGYAATAPSSRTEANLSKQSATRRPRQAEHHRTGRQIARPEGAQQDWTRNE